MDNHSRISRKEFRVSKGSNLIKSFRFQIWFLWVLQILVQFNLQNILKDLPRNLKHILIPIEVKSSIAKMIPKDTCVNLCNQPSPSRHRCSTQNKILFKKECWIVFRFVNRQIGRQKILLIQIKFMKALKHFNSHMTTSKWHSP